jgi:4-hydroxy-tetrahydrodipicolinate reductase
MKLILSGYGKMGREIEKIALERNHQIVAIIDNASDWELLLKNKTHADVVVDFSMPSVVIDNIKKCFSLNVPIVTGTTGWHDQADSIIKLCKSSNQTLFFSSNFSIGVNIFFEVNKRLAQLMNTQEQYEVAIEESHHLQKLDSPSGTAITLANDIIKNTNRKKNWVNSDEKKDTSICISSVRAENIIGIHKVSYDSPIDIIEIRHAAKSRRGLAIGAVIAAEWVAGKKGVFEMKDLLNF